MRSELQIATPEGVVFSYRLAGPITRCLATLIDVLVVGILLSLIMTVVGMLALLSPDLAMGASTLAAFVIPTLYGALFEWLWRGQTVGKKLLKLRVVDASGLKLQFTQILARNLLRPVDMLPGFYVLGGMVAWFTPKFQRLGDVAANTVVISIANPPKPDLEKILVDKFNSLRSYPHIAGRLRQRVSPEEARIALSAVLRREELEPVARVRLFHDLANHFKGMAQFPEEVVESLPDEQFLRNVVDVLFRAR